MKISLVLATFGRFNEVKAFLDCLKTQIFKNFELIVVDQNADYKIAELIRKYEEFFEIKYIRTSQKGLSRARNLGIKKISGDIIAFPDDDCLYNNNTLQLVVDVFRNNKIDGLTGKHVKEFRNCDDNKLVPKKFRKLNVYNVWFWSISFTIFLKKEVISDVGIFDESLGVGSGTPYGSGEETDYLIRAIKLKKRIVHVPSLCVMHPYVCFDDSGVCDKAYKYSVGRMFVLKKHNYPRVFILINRIYPLFKLLFNMYSKKKMIYYYKQFLGRFEN